MKVKELKERYGRLAKKYKLPSFEELNHAFEIDRIERDPEELLREVRKSMMDKIIGYIRFLEMLINPVQAPPSFMMFMKNVTSAEKTSLENVYKKFIELELASIKIEIDYSEEEEADLIKKVFNKWASSKEGLKRVVGFMERNWHGTSTKKQKSYFG